MSCKNIYLPIIVFVACALSACHEEQPLQPAPKEAALHLTLGIPDVGISSRGISDDPENANGKWSAAELLADGRILDELTLLLLDADNKLVADAVNIDYLPANGVTEEEHIFEELVVGNKYRLIAIANYGDLLDFPDVATMTKGTVIGKEHALYNYTLDAGDDCIVTGKQPLSLVQDIVVSGEGDTYEVSGELVRTYARLRIEVANKSENYDLTINGLSFSTDFAQREAYLLTDPDSPDRNFTDMVTGKPNLLSTEALAPFDNTTSIPKTKNTENNVLGSRVLFDAYILESRNGNAGYTYKLDVEYGASYTTTTTTYTASATGYANINTLKNNRTDESLFLIQNTRTRAKDNNNRYNYVMVSANGQVYQNAPNLESLASSKEYLWKLEPVTGAENSFYIYNVGRNVYIGESPGVDVVFQTGVKETYFTISNLTNGDYGGIQLEASQGNNPRYMNDYQAASETIRPWNANDEGNGFVFYPVTKVTTPEVHPAEYDTPIPLRTVESGEARDVTQISRNDFINVLVNVAYNENIGTVEFYVADWKPVSGEATFE